jgi:hypothetical protein
MSLHFKFERELDNRWYIVLPEWEGDHAELEMVCGADQMLNILAQGEDEVYLHISLTHIDNSMELSFIEEDDGGAWYNVTSDLFEFPIWLCHVTKFVFGELPTKMWIRN